MECTSGSSGPSWSGVLSGTAPTTRSAIQCGCAVRSCVQMSPGTADRDLDVDENYTGGAAKGDCTFFAIEAPSEAPAVDEQAPVHEICMPRTLRQSWWNCARRRGSNMLKWTRSPAIRFPLLWALLQSHGLTAEDRQDGLLGQRRRTGEGQEDGDYQARPCLEADGAGSLNDAGGRTPTGSGGLHGEESTAQCRERGARQDQEQEAPSQKVQGPGPRNSSGHRKTTFEVAGTEALGPGREGMPTSSRTPTAQSQSSRLVVDMPVAWGTLGNTGNASLSIKGAGSSKSPEADGQEGRGVSSISASTKVPSGAGRFGSDHQPHRQAEVATHKKHNKHETSTGDNLNQKDAADLKTSGPIKDPMHADTQVGKEKVDEDKKTRRPSGLRTARRSKTPNRDNKPEPELYELSSHSSKGNDEDMTVVE